MSLPPLSASSSASSSNRSASASAASASSSTSAHAADLDALLAALATPLRRAADHLLDLREAARSGATPGRCIRCYFELLAAAPRSAQPRLTPLRAWLEARIEAAATDPEGRLLEALPLRLDTEDLESCCRRLMREVTEDRAYPAAHIQLGFRYKSAALAA